MLDYSKPLIISYFTLIQGQIEATRGKNLWKTATFG